MRTSSREQVRRRQRGRRRWRLMGGWPDDGRWHRRRRGAAARESAERSGPSPAPHATTEQEPSRWKRLDPARSCARGRAHVPAGSTIPRPTGRAPSAGRRCGRARGWPASTHLYLDIKPREPDRSKIQLPRPRSPWGAQAHTCALGRRRNAAASRSRMVRRDHGNLTREERIRQVEGPAGCSSSRWDRHSPR